jgi:TIR domain
MSEPTSANLFVSFAPEDWALAEWLTLRLTREGYRIWCSRFSVLGGARYPSHAEDAIMHARHVLAFLSRASLANATTMKHVTLAVELGRARREPFLIPLVVDAPDVTELDAVTGGAETISFNERWETGCRALLAKLEGAGAPRLLADGERVAGEARQLLASRRSWHTVL